MGKRNKEIEEDRFMHHDGRVNETDDKKKIGRLRTRSRFAVRVGVRRFVYPHLAWPVPRQAFPDLFLDSPLAARYHHLSFRGRRGERIDSGDVFFRAAPFSGV